MSNVKRDRNDDIEIRINETKLNIIQYQSELQDCISDENESKNDLQMAYAREEYAEERLVDLGVEIQFNFIKSNLTKEQINNVSTILEEESSRPLGDSSDEETITRGAIPAGNG